MTKKIYVYWSSSTGFFKSPKATEHESDPDITYLGELTEVIENMLMFTKECL